MSAVCGCGVPVFKADGGICDQCARWHRKDLLDTAKDLLAHLDLHLESMRKVAASIPEAEGSLSYIDGAMSHSRSSARITIAKAEGSAD